MHHNVNAMLSFFISIPITGLTLWLILRSAARLWQEGAGRLWWIVLVAIVVGGGYVGRQLSRYDVRVSPDLIWGGLPLPIGFFHFEDGQWVDFVPPYPVQCCNIAADTAIPIIVLLLPWTIVRRQFSRVPNPSSLTPSP
jgi:hypothetical protein